MSNDLTQFFGGAAFTAATIEPQTDFEVMPPNKYAALIEKAEVKQTKAGNGHYIELTMSVLEAPYKGRKLWDRLNIDNPNTQTVEIAMRVLSALRGSIGLQTITNTDQLVNQVIVAHVKVKGDQNYVRTYSAPAEAQPTVQSQQAPTAQASPLPESTLVEPTLPQLAPWAR